MEFLIVTLVLVAFIFLSMRYGYDSRDAAYSKEREFAQLGMTWDLHTWRLDELRREAALWRLHQQVTCPRRRIRRRVSVGFYALARWLDPEPAPATTHRRRFTDAGD